MAGRLVQTYSALQFATGTERNTATNAIHKGRNTQIQDHERTTHAKETQDKTLIHAKTQKQYETEERYHDCEYPEEATRSILVELFVSEFDEGESHILPLLREDAGLDVQSADEPGNEVEKYVTDQNEQN